MKKIVLVMVVAFIGLAANAQKINIQSALDEIKDGNFAKAKQYIDKATKDGSSTATSAKAWLVKGAIYQAIGRNVDMKDGKPIPYVAEVNGRGRSFDIAKANTLRVETPNALEEALGAYKNVIKYSKKVDKFELQPLVLDLLFQSFNVGVKQYSAKKHAEAIKAFNLVKEIRGINNGKLLDSKNLIDRLVPAKKNINEITKNSSLYSAYSAYNLGDDKATLAFAEESIANKSADDQIYVMAAEFYKKNGDNDKYLSMINTGMKLFPDSKTLRNEQLNYFIKSGNQEEALAKLKEALVKDPGNAELQFNTAVIYDEMAKKTNDASLASNAENAYKAAIKLDPKNPDYIFNLGGMFFNKAKDLTDKMNKEKDDNKYQVMKKERDGIMAKSLPLMEQAKTVLEGSNNFKSEAYQNTYKQTLQALNTAYILLGKNDKVAEIAPLLKGLK